LWSSEWERENEHGKPQRWIFRLLFTPSLQPAAQIDFIHDGDSSYDAISSHDTANRNKIEVLLKSSVRHCAKRLLREA